VRLCVTVAGENWEFERTGTSVASELSAWRGAHQIPQPLAALASAFGDLNEASLVEAVRSWGVLRQDALRSALDAGASALHERLAAVVGLERVSRFADGSTAALRELRRVRTRIRDVRDDLVEQQKQAKERLTRAEASSNALVRDRSSRAGRLLALTPLLPDGITISPDCDANEDRFAALVADLSTVSSLLLQRVTSSDSTSTHLWKLPSMTLRHGSRTLRRRRQTQVKKHR
jgi:hypothetical protein